MTTEKDTAMSTHITTHNPVRSDVSAADPAAPAARRPRSWAVAGIVSGIAGLGTMVTSSMVNAVYDPDLVDDTSQVADKLADQTGPMLAFHLFALVGAVTMVVFAAGLQRRLRDRIGDGLAATVAFAGLVGTAVVIVLGSGLDTEFFWAFLEDDQIVDDANAALYNHWIGTIPWVWVLAGLAGLALFSAYRSGAVPRWIGLVGLVLGGLTLLLGISPLQYMAGMTGPLWMLVTAIGFVVGDRAYRDAA
jgi:hypothetical protein